MDYIKARTYIDESHRFGGEMGLEAITCLLEKLGNPQKTLQFIIDTKNKHLCFGESSEKNIQHGD